MNFLKYFKKLPIASYCSWSNSVDNGERDFEIDKWVKHFAWALVPLYLTGSLLLGNIVKENPDRDEIQERPTQEQSNLERRTITV
jgi:hypothetical protein